MAEVATVSRNEVLETIGDPEFDAFLFNKDEDASGVVNNKKEEKPRDELVKNRVRRASGPRINYVRNNSYSEASAAGVPLRTFKNSRRSRNGFGRGLPKKGGAGGKGTWGALGSEVLDEDTGRLDPNDPNYEEPEEEMVVDEVEVAREPPTEADLYRVVQTCVLEYYDHNDTEEVYHTLEEQVWGVCGGGVGVLGRGVVVVAAVELAMDHKASRREMTSVLLADLYSYTLKERDYEAGYDALIRNLSELVKDTPAAPTVLANFLARSVADDCVPPSFLSRYIGQLEGSHGPTCLARAQSLISMRHGFVRLDEVWGVGGPTRPVKVLVRRITLLLREYVSCGDVGEATCCLRELEVPHFHHELVYEAVVMVLESHGDQGRVRDLMVTLLASLARAVIVTTNQLREGFLRVFEDVDGIVLDAPQAYTHLAEVVRVCVSRGLVTAELARRMPTRGRRRFMSESAIGNGF